MRDFVGGGVTRRHEMGRLDIKAGVPAAPGGRVLSQTGWGSREQLRNAGVGAKGTDVPQLWLCGGSGAIPPVYQRFVAEGCEPRLIRRRDCTVGVCYSDAYADYCLLTGLLPPDSQAPREVQTAAVFEGIEDALTDAGMTFGDVVRTWLYMDDILDWYDQFNRVRDSFFRARRVYDGLVPASTGIGSANLCGSAITACVIAVRPKPGCGMSIEAVPSPLQCAALQYGSSFSRAVELASPGSRTLMVSGTASIEPGGATARAGDLEGQIQVTMDVVGAILASRGMGWQDAARAVMYLKDESYLGAWQRWLRARGLEDLPLVNVEADVCRDDLLVELEVDAVKLS
ncbi:MAG: Rid family hydrolase [Kiritimatiellae bacterium]|nr:Rid family hydrolase [Kiritimatiellia bacterium]MDD4025247.1 Rid family hydrolase [Kiritimatiellia bacterium]